MAAPGAWLEGRRAHLLPVVADDDHELLRFELADRGDGVPEQGPPGQGVQDLGGTGLHPGALARGEDDNRGRGSFAHEYVHLLGYRADYLPGHLLRDTPIRETAVNPLLIRRIPVRTWPETSGEVADAGVTGVSFPAHDGPASAGAEPGPHGKTAGAPEGPASRTALAPRGTCLGQDATRFVQSLTRDAWLVGRLRRVLCHVVRDDELARLERALARDRGQLGAERLRLRAALPLGPAGERGRDRRDDADRDREPEGDAESVVERRGDQVREELPPGDVSGVRGRQVY